MGRRRRENTPGPGAYVIKSTIGRDSPRAGFGSAPRGGPANRGSTAPGPGQNQLPSPDVTLTKASSFSFGARTKVSKSYEKAPGPGAYGVKSTLQGPKFSMSGAPHRGKKAAESPVPGPGAYSARMRSDVSTAPAYTFSGGAERMKKKSGGGDMTVGPGQYTIPSTIGRNSPAYSLRARDEYAFRQAASASPGPIYSAKLPDKGGGFSFGGGNRFGVKQAASLNPGPGAYSMPARGRNSPAFGFGTEKRMNSKENQRSPGPIYTLHAHATGPTAPRYSMGGADRSRAMGAATDTPGPVYQVERAHDAVRRAAPKLSFSNAAQRPDEAKISTTPGPQYQPNLKTKPSAPSVSFGSASRGGPANAAKASTPGPGVYQSKSLVGHKAASSTMRSSPGYSMAARTIPANSMSKEELSRPGPGAYTPRHASSLPAAPAFTMAGRDDEDDY